MSKKKKKLKSVDGNLQMPDDLVSKYILQYANFRYSSFNGVNKCDEEATIDNTEFNEEINKIIEESVISLYDKYKKENVKNVEIEISLELRNIIMKHISNKIKNGDIDLQIDMIKKYENMINVIYTKFFKGKKIYQDYFNNSSLKNKRDMEHRMIMSVWNDSLIESLEKHEGKELFTIFALKTFRENLSKVEIDKYIKIYEKH